MRLFDPQGRIVEDCVGTDIDRSTTRIDDQNLLATLGAYQQTSAEWGHPDGPLGFYPPGYGWHRS